MPDEYRSNEVQGMKCGRRACMNSRGKGECWDIIGVGIGVFIVATSDFGLGGEVYVVSARVVDRAERGLAVRRTNAGDVGRVVPEDGGPASSALDF
jgi:hypothetical protein